MNRGPDLDILVVGEALVDVVRDVAGTERRYPGGSPANVAVGLARLRRTVRLLTQLGADDDADLVRRHLAAAGVVVDDRPTATGRTSTALAVLDDNGVATYTFDLAWTLSPDDLGEPHAAVVHTGSIAAVLEPGAAAVASFLDTCRDRVMVTYDPNLRPTVLGDADTVRPHVERLVAAADVVKASEEDLDWLYPSARVEDVARTWVMSGPQLVVVTQGGDETIAVHGVHLYRAPVPPVSVADTVGAGDAFMAGLIDGLSTHGAVGSDARARVAGLDHDAIADVLDRAAAVAAVTVSRPGADPPTAAELD